jgi:carbamoyltransferase
MRILGISCYFHDASACLLVDGKLVAAAEEERFTRIKHDFSFPDNAIRFCLEQGGIEGRDLDYVVFFEKPFVKFERLIKTAVSGFPKTYMQFAQSMRTWLFDKLWIKSHIESSLGIDRKRILFSDHHMSHAASAYFCSPFEKSAVLTFDGVGEWATATMGIGDGSSLTIKRELRFPHSLGLLYSAFTAFLGFEVNEGEYKVMGMAPYGTPKYTNRIREIVHQNDDGSIWMDHSNFSFHHSTDKSFTSRFEKLFGEPRDPSVAFFTNDTGYPPYYGDRPSNYDALLDYNQYYADIAASIQRVTEEFVLKLVNEAHKETGLTNLCMAGGVALNSVANGRILNETPFENIYIQPSAGDGGGSLGAALYAWHCALGNNERFVMDHAYWGQEYSQDAIQKAVEESGYSWTRLEDEAKLIDATVDRIVDGNVVGWFQGRFEWGPRALGNRSIVADPRRADMKDIVNGKIKFREPFRPFAPSVIAEAAPDYFKVPNDGQGMLERFMLIVAPVKDSKQEAIPAVSHMGTARLQTVYKDTNPRYHELIRKFGEATGEPVLLNTSFNVRGEPIVTTPEDALNTFRNSGIDALVMGDILVEKT